MHDRRTFLPYYRNHKIRLGNSLEQPITEMKNVVYLLKYFCGVTRSCPISLQNSNKLFECALNKHIFYFLPVSRHFFPLSFFVKGQGHALRTDWSTQKTTVLSFFLYSKLLLIKQH